MKLTILIALGTTLVTLAQKPTLEPQKDWSKERTQLWPDSLVKSLTQETKPAQNVNSGGYYNQNPPISDEQRIKEKNDLEIQIKNLKAKNQIEGMAQLSKDIEEADMVFQGVAYQILERPLPENKGYFLLKFRVYSVLKGEKKYKIGDHIFKCKNYGGYKGDMFGYNIFLNYTVKNGEITHMISNSSHFENGKFDGKYYNWNMYCEFPTRDSLFNYLSSFKGLNKDNDLGPYFVDYGVDYIENNIIKPKKITFEQYITNVRKEIALKKKLQLGLQNARTESVQTNNPAFSVTDFNPKQIRGGIGEQLTITGLGFGNSYNSMLGIRFKDADKGGIGANIDLLYMKNLDAYDIFSWSDSKIVINFPSIVSAANGISTTTGVPGSGTFLLASYVGTNMVSSVTSPMAIDVKYAIINKFENDVKSRFYLAKYKNQCSPNLYTFYVDATIKNNPSILATVQKALRDWSDILKIDIKLAQDANNNILTTIGTSLSDDNKSIIFFAPFPIPYESASMITSKANESCNLFPLKSFIFNPDIAINSNVNWHFSTGDNKPIGKVDFYASLMHEIGHCLGVDHIIDEHPLFVVLAQRDYELSNKL